MKSPRDLKWQIRTSDLTGLPSTIPTESPRDLKSRSMQWRVYFPVRIADEVTDGFIPLVNPSEKVNIWPLCRPSPSPFLLLLPNPNSPHLQITSPPSHPNKILPHLSTTSCISWSFVVTTSLFWFTDGFYQFL